MKIIITESKILNVIQKAIDFNLTKLKDLKQQDEDSIPDDISELTWEDIHTVEKIIAVNHRITDFKITKDYQVHIVSLDFIYDSVTGINIPDILYDLQQLCSKTLGMRLHFSLGKEINKYKDYGQW